MSPLRPDGTRGRILAWAGIAVWAALIIAAHVAIVVTGGLLGPLAPWCLTPLVAVLILNQPRALPEAAALCVCSVGALGLLHWAGLIGPAPIGVFCLGLSALAVLSLGAGLVLGMFSVRLAVLQSFDRRLRTDDLAPLLAQHPHRLLVLGPKGQIVRGFGTLPIWADPAATSLGALVQDADRPCVSAALRQAMTTGTAHFGFVPQGAQQHYGVVDLKALSRLGFIAIVRDASGDHAKEMALVQERDQAEAESAARARFLANMSHELRTPLNAIMGFSDIMRSQMFGPLTPKYTEYSGLIHEAGRHLLDLINDVLDMSKIEANRYDLSLELIDVREPVNSALRLLRLQADDAGLRLRGVLPPDALNAQVDRRAIKQIVINLLSNALKFTPKGGQVTVSVLTHGDGLELTVVDTGVGIAPDDLARLGRPFEQVNNTGLQVEGTGLGLSLVRALAQLHGGDMTIESRLGEGTAVTVRLPVVIAGTPQEFDQTTQDLPRAAE